MLQQVIIFSVMSCFIPNLNAKDTVVLFEVNNGAKWQGWVKNTKEYKGWKLASSFVIENAFTYSVCDVDKKSANNWLRSPYIDRRDSVSLHIEVTFTVRSCSNYPNPSALKQCKETFSLMYLQSDGPDERLASDFNHSTYELAYTIAPDTKWLSDSVDDITKIMNKKTALINVARRGLYVAFRDEGSCTALYTVRVYYLECSQRTYQFALYPRTPAAFGYQYTNSNTGCIEGAEHSANNPPSGMCAADGQWVPQSSQACHCKPGFFAVKDTQCLKCPANWYKPLSGIGPCVSCPAHSLSAEASAHCVCKKGFFRAHTDKMSSPCTEPPGAPVRPAFINAEDQVMLSWESSDSTGGRADLFYRVECDGCSAAVRYLPGAAQLIERRVTVTGLESNTQYTFRIYALNGVSDIAKVEHKFVQVLVKTKASFVVQRIRVTFVDKNSAVLQWENPPGNLRRILSYEVLVAHKNNSSKAQRFETERPEIRLQQFIPNVEYSVKIRMKTSQGWGNYSQWFGMLNVEEAFFDTPKPVAVERSDSDSVPISIIVGTICAILICLTVVIVFAVLVLRRNFYLQLFRSKIAEKTLALDNNMPYNAARIPMLYQRPAVASQFYGDPLTYEDPNQSFQLFHKELDSNWIFIDSVLGCGEFGNVCRGQLKRPDEMQVECVAIKTLKPGASEKSKLDFLMEANIMGQFDHPNVLGLEGVVTCSDPVMIVTPFMTNGSLDSFLREHDGELTIFHLIDMLHNIASGMKYLSNINFVHRDLAARNILVASNLLCKIADFGLSRELDSDSANAEYTTKGGKIPIRWTAPEAIAYRKFTSMSDVWSFGVVLWEVVAYGERPYWNWTNPDVIAAVFNGYRLPRPLGCPQSLYQLALDCWCHDRAERPRFEQIRRTLDHIKETPGIEQESEIVSCMLNETVDVDTSSNVELNRSVAEWLIDIKMDMYTEAFHRHGVATLLDISQMTLTDLLGMDISLAGHQKKLMSNIQRLRHQFMAVQMKQQGLVM